MENYGSVGPDKQSINLERPYHISTLCSCLRNNEVVQYNSDGLINSLMHNIALMATALT